MEKQLDLLQGTLDMLILKAISLSPLHGYGILLRIQQISEGAAGNPAGISCTPRSTASNITAGLPANGESPRTSGARATTGSPRLGNAGCNRKPNAGTR